MNNRILVEIYVPAAEQAFDVYLPEKCRMNEVNKMVTSALNELTSGKFIATDETVLCDADTGAVFNVNMEVGELEIKNGSRLMLI